MSFTVLSLLFSLATHAQSPPPDSFNPGANETVHSLAVQRDGKILVGGSFTNLGGQSRTRIARLNPDGTLDAGFNPEANHYVGSLVVQADGKILVGGHFTTLGGQMRNRIARLNPNGTVDPWFNPEANNLVSCLVVQADGKILVGGSFTTLGGQARNKIARLNPDGTLDTGFNPGANSSVYSLAIQADGKIVVGGEFSTLGGQTRNRIARLNPDGTVDAGFNPGAGSYGYVHSLAVQADGKIVVGGEFSTLGGHPRSRIARLNPDGTLDMGFNPGANSTVVSVAVQADGKILAGGVFFTLGGQPRNNLARLNPDGTLDAGFNSGANSYGYVHSLAVQADGKIVVGGEFSTLGGQPRSKIARLNNTEPATQSLTFDGSTVTWLRGGTSPEVGRTVFEASTNDIDWVSLGEGTRIPGGWTLTGVPVGPDSILRARGFTTGGRSAWFVETYYGRFVIVAPPESRTNDAGTVATFRVVVGGSEPLSYQWLKDGRVLSDAGNITGAASAVLTLTNVLRTDAGGYRVVVSSPSGSVTSLVATLSVTDPAITLSPMSQNGELGQSVIFTVAAAGTPPLYYQWWKDGVALPGQTGSSLTLTNLQAEDIGNYRLVVTGWYGSVTSAVARLTLDFIPVDTGFIPRPDYFVYSLAVQTDGRIVAGGEFTNMCGQTRNRIARLNPDGTLDTDFNPGANQYVHSLVVQADGKILAGGHFTTMGGQSRTYLARLNPDGTLDTGFNPLANSYVYTLAVQADGKILVGGWFTTLGGQSRTYLARLNPDGTLDTGFNPMANSYVYSLGIQADGKIVVGGDFTTLGGWSRNHIARLNPDGSLDTGFNPGANSLVQSLAVQADGKIVVGGSFTTLGGQTRNQIARLNPDGTLDTGFNPGATDSVYSLAVQADGKILVGGWFTMLGGQTRKGIARLNPDGTLDAEINPGANNRVYSLIAQVDGKILVGGAFTNLGGLPSSYIGRLKNLQPTMQSLSYDGLTITWLRSGACPEVWRTMFEASTNATDWVSLGEGTRIPGGWSWTGSPVAPHSILRARGFTSGGLGNGSAWFVESILRVTNTPPVLEPIASRLLAFGQTLLITNRATDPEGARRLLFALAPGAPAGMTMNSTNGVLKWKPACAQGGSIHQVTILVTEDGIGGMSSAQNFAVVVPECLLTELGTTVSAAGDRGCVPVFLESSEDLTSLSITLQVPPGRFTNFTTLAVAPEVQRAELSLLSPTQAVVHLVAQPGQVLRGPTHAADVCFELLSAQASAFVPLEVMGIIGLSTNGAPVDNPVCRAGRAAVVGEQPLLEAIHTSHGLPVLILYGQPGTTNTLESTSRLDPTNTWTFHSQATIPPSNLFQLIQPFGTTNNSSIFLRARRQ